jgi:Pol polyprotein/gag-pre-integrase-like protein
MVGGLPSSSASGIWIIDSGASHHMSPQLESFVSLSPHSSPPIVTADGTTMPLEGIGSVATSSIFLDQVYYVPNLALNLCSVGQLCDSGQNVWFSDSHCLIQDRRSQMVIGTGHRQGRLYVLDQLRVSDDVAASSVDLSSFRLSSSSSPFYLWHSRLGHVSASRLRFLTSTGALGPLNSHDISDCSGCKLAKFSALPFQNSVSSSFAPFDLVHSDVWGPSPVPTKGGSRYYVSFIDIFLVTLGFFL